MVIPAASDLSRIAKSLRRHIIEMTHAAGSGHPGGSLSAAEILTALFFSVMRHDPKRPDWEGRDRFYLSKGHACPVLYAALGEAGYFDKKEFFRFRKLGSILQGHPHRLKTPGVEASSGSLGQGLSLACGTALGFKLDGRPNRVYCLLGDGELQEGQVWEAAMAAGHYRLDNLCAIVDYNGLQIDGPVEQVMGLAPLAEKWRSFRWNVLEVDGHRIEALLSAFDRALNSKGRPTAILAHTVKGKGVSFMENRPEWHGRAPNNEECQKALNELT